ncbi:MAG: hypothetical protein R2727_09690 [Bacteroidales bacterium]
MIGGIDETTTLTYQVLVTDAISQVKIGPCDPVFVRAAVGETPLLFINELMADNEVTIQDEFGSFSDWVEVYNGDDEEVYLGDYFMTDDFDSPGKWRPITLLREDSDYSGQTGIRHSVIIMPISSWVKDGEAVESSAEHYRSIQ